MQKKKNHALSEGIVAHKKLALGTKENPESDVTEHALRSSMSASVEKRAMNCSARALILLNKVLL